MPRHVLHGRPIFHRLLSHGSIRNSLASQVATASTHDAERFVEIRNYRSPSQALDSRRGSANGTAPSQRQSAYENYSNEYPGHSRDWNVHPGDRDHVRPFRRRRHRPQTANNDDKSNSAERTTFPFDQYGGPSSQGSRIGWARIQPELSKSWRNQSPNILLKKILEPQHDLQFWRRQVAMARSKRLPIILLQMLIRREESQLQGQKPLLRLLPTPREWQEVLSIVRGNGHTLEDLEHYLYILQGKTDDERCERLLERDSATPTFILNFLIRQYSTISQVTTLSSLIDYCRKLSKNSNGGDTRVGQNGQSFAAYEIKAMTPAEFILTMGLLAHHCQCLEPRLILKLAGVAVEYIESMATLPIVPDKIYRSQCAIFNNTLKLLQPQPRSRPAQRSSPNSFFWEAQRILLAMSAGMERPLLVDRGGFQAIRHVLSSLPKNQTEIHSSLRHASTWPPYLQPGDGIDEVADPEDSWSRSVRAGILMQEAGFSKEEQDDALDVLLGMATDGTPTIQQRTTIAQERNLSIWEASIRATRNAHEAWDRFRNPQKLV
ncbi:hypothetical protein PT974_04088 [Cladobotryum mycophilum]|uniref:Uncharacterized protein n=1 Tax=Cladobotryum mycophilum TaxID=491253 RepID=A0ABR0SV80_9HYPO